MSWFKGCCCGTRLISCSVCPGSGFEAPSTIEVKINSPVPDFNDLCGTCEDDLGDGSGVGGAAKFVLRRTGCPSEILFPDLPIHACVWCVNFAAVKGCVYNWLYVDLYRAAGSRNVILQGVLSNSFGTSEYYYWRKDLGAVGVGFSCTGFEHNLAFAAAVPSDNCRSGSTLDVGFPTLS